MSGALGKIVDPLGLFSGGDKKAEAPAAAPESAPAAAAAGPTNERINARADDLATREQSLGQRAGAAGAMRSDNDADVLGYVLPRKRSAGRAILG